MFLKKIELQMVSDPNVPYGPIPNGVPKGLVVKSDEDVFRVFGFLSGHVQEEMYALYLDTKSRVLGFYMVSRGTLDRTVFSPADILRPALLLGCASIILIHNHPSGVSDPSGDDVMVTKRMNEICKIMGLSLLDHVIIGEGNYKSIIGMV